MVSGGFGTLPKHTVFFETMIPATPRLNPSLNQIKKAVADWNKIPGEIWGMKVSVDDGLLIQCLQIADSVFRDGRFPEKPGPFKLLASYSLAVQYFSPYSWTRERGGAHYDPAVKYWDPRLTVWTLPYISDVLTLGGAPMPLVPTFPTPHHQLETINYLRIVHQSKQGASEIDSDHLIEQVLLFGLCIEAAAYASYPDTSRLEPIMKFAGKCIYKNDDPRWPDQHFNDKEFFDQYFEAGEILLD